MFYKCYDGAWINLAQSCEIRVCYLGNEFQIIAFFYNPLDEEPHEKQYSILEKSFATKMGAQSKLDEIIKSVKQ